MGLSNCITKARDAIKKSAKKQRNQAMRSGAPDTSEQFAETQEKALVGLIARIGDVQALDGDNQAAADAIRSAIEDLMLDREALAIQVERAGLEMPAAPDVAVAEQADQPSEMESAVIENSTVSISLSPESARDVRIDRIVASQPNPADKARMRGFYDEMLGIPSRVGEYSKISAVSYEQGRKRGMDRRNLLNGRPWYEVEKVRDGSRWKWVIYQEGVFKRSGSAKSEKEADLAIDIARVELTEQADQPGAETVTAPAEADASFTKRGDYWYHSGERAKAIAKAAGLVSTMRNGVPEVAIADHAREQIAGELKAAGIDVRFSTADAVSQPKTDAATEAKQDKAPADARLTSAQASDQMEWRNLGQRDGTKTQALFFYETAEDMAAHRGSMQYGEVTQYDGGKWQFDGVSYDSLGSAKKAAEQAAVVRLVKDGYAENPFAKYDTEAKSYGYEVKPDGLIHLNGEPTGVAISEKSGRLRVQSSSGTLLGTYPAEADAIGRFLKSFWYAEKKDVSEPSGKEQTSLPDRIRRIIGLDQAKLDAYIPESAVSKLGNKWVYDLYGGNRSQDMLDTKKEAIDRATRHKKLLQDQYDRPESYWDIASLLASKRLERIESYMRQGIPEMEAGRRVREEIPDDWTPPEVADDEAPKVENQNVAPLSSVINKVNAKNDEDLTDADRIATVESHSEFTDRLNDGNVTIDEFKARFESVKKSKDALIAELGKKTKPELLAILGGYRADRMKNDKKDRIVDSVYTSMLDDFVLGDSISYSFGSKYEDVIGGYVARYGQADIDAYAERIKASRAEREQRAEKIAAAVKDPQDFAEYQVYIKAKMAEGMTLQQARMSLPAEKRAMFDNEMAEASRNARGERKEVAKTQVQAAAQTTAGQLFETKHTKTGEPLFVVKTADRVDRDIYNQWNATAKRLGGYYSSYRGNGAIPGFTFKTKEGAEAFMQYLGGDTVAAQDAIKTDRDAFADDRSQSAVERLNEMADRLDANADSVLSADRKTNTERRARFAASAEAAANSNKAMAQTMRNIAKSISEGTAKFLDMVRQKAQVEMLRSKLQAAKQDEAKAQDPNGWYTKELHKKPATVETADFATWPTYTAYRSDLAQMGRALLQLDGGKRLGQSVLKVADDVTNAYKAFAKENLYKVSTFKTSDGGPAVFSTTDKAEEAIARSGFKGKATTISFKRGEHLVIMGPQMARENGIWQGDDDQRITLAPDFAEQIVAFNKSLNKRTQDIRMPWVFDNVAQERARWKAMGIETPAEMRAALREFVSLNEQAKEVDKIKQMERAMIGRRNDGLDFFPTSPDVVQQMLESAEIEPGMSVLEPSAGMGHIADQIRAAGVDPDVIELSGDRRELLEAKGFNVIGSDFTELKSRDFTYGDVFRAPDGTLGVMRGSGGLGSNRVGLDFLDENGQADRRRSGWYARDELVGVEKRAGNSGYDRIIMNPPFSNRRDAEHVQHAYTLLRPGGRIVAIMGEGVFFGQDKKAVEFREWLESVGGTSEKLPEGSFLAPSLPVNTAVNARMVVIDKQDTVTEKTDSGIALLSPSLGRVDADKVDVATARAVVSGLLAGWRNAPNSSVVATASDLPVVVREELANQGEKTARGVYHGGTFYLVADEHSTEAEIEETVFHEVWSHYGLRSMFGAQTTTKLAAVFDAISASGFIGLPGKDAFRAFSRQHGFETAQTEAMLRKGETFDPRFTEAVKKRILVEELIAKVQEKGAPDTLKRKALELIGAIREWLRSVGFGHLMKYSDADLMRLVQRARDTVVYGKPGSAGKGNSPAVLMRAYHGSPYKFDKFSTDHMSKGEGAQAYGWGLYFADKQDVAEWYRAKLSKGFVGWDGSKVDVYNPRHLAGIELFTSGGDREDAIESIELYLKTQAIPYEQQVAYREALNHIRNGTEAKRTKEVGQLYEVEIPSDDTMLLWDKPLSEQPAKVRAALEGMPVLRRMRKIDKNAWASYRGQDIYKELSAKDGAAALLHGYEGSDEAASKYLNSLGISGIKYLDGQSRSAGEGNFNYVIFADKDVDITATFDGDKRIPRSPSAAETITIDGVERPTMNSNGKPIAKTEEGLRNFYAWFGDSKVVDDHGRPLVVYHGTTLKFYEFEDRNDRQGFYFAFDKKYADLFAEDAYGVVLDAVIKAEKVADFRGGVSSRLYGELRNAGYDGSLLSYQPSEVWELFDGDPDLADALKNAGYDGVYLKEPDLDGVGEFDSLLVFSPTQIKSATGNFGQFDGTNPDIRYNVAEGEASLSDQAIYAMAEEGRGVGEILDHIAASSSSSFNRALAGLLKTAGVKTKITVGGSTGWALNSGEGGKFSAGYNPASDTAALFRSQAAERNILHELVHAATLTALERNGLASSKMKALFAHVKRSGKLDGTYGMTSIDEFAAEVFTNPKFQELLKTIEAAPINGKKARSAWDWFVGIVRGILGMEAGQDNALSQALEIGVAVMEENTAMRDGKVAFTEITGKEIDAMPGNTLQSKATNWLRQNLQGKTVVNDSTGWEISTGRKGINKAMSHSGTESVARSVAAIPDLLKNAVLVQTEQNNNASERDDVPWVHHFYAPVRIGGADYVARIVVKEAKDGTRFYDYDTSNEISPADPDSTLPFSQRRGAEPGARPAMSMSELLSYVKEEHGGKDSRFTPGKTLGKVRAMADEDTVSGTSIRRGTAEEAQANGFTMRAYRGVSAASPFNDSGTVWLTTSRSAAESYATEVFGYEDPEVIEVWVKPDQIPVWDMRKVSDEELETLNPDEFGNPQNIGIYRNSDDSMLGGSGAGTVIHAPVESIFVIDDEAAGRIRYNTGKNRTRYSDDYQKRADQLDRAFTAMGLVSRRESSRVSKSEYVEVQDPNDEATTYKIRVSNHQLPNGYTQPDFDVVVNADHHGGHDWNRAGDWIDAVAWIAEQTGTQPKGLIKGMVAKRAAELAEAKLAADALRESEKSRAASRAAEIVKEKVSLSEWLDDLPNDAELSVSKKGNLGATLPDGRSVSYGRKPFGMANAVKTIADARKYIGEAPTPNSAKLGFSAPVDAGMQERTARAVNPGSSEPAQSFSGAGSDANVTLGIEDGNSIRYNVADDGWSVAEPSKMDDFIYTLQDKQIDLKRVIDAIKATGKKIADQFNPYLQEELFYGRSAKGVKDFLDFELRPLLKEMQARNVDMGDFEEYLWNRHAEERNIQIAKINKDMPDGGSGIMTEDARDYLAGIDPERRATLEELAEKIDAINKANQRVLVESGLETQETIDAWNGAYKHYVPLQREDVDTGHVGTGKGYSIRGSSSKRAMGSGRQVVDIIANLTMQRERNIVRAEKNRVSNALMGLALQNPNDDFWQVDTAPKERTVQEKAIYYVVDSNGERTGQEFTRIDDADRAARAIGGSIEQTFEDRVVERVVPGFQSRDNVILTRVNGQDHYIIFNERNERALRMAMSLKNLDTDTMSRALSVVGMATRYLASVNTQYNPVFGVINLVRDVQGALINLQSTPLAGQQKRVFGYTISALRGIYSDLRAHRRGEKPSSQWADLFEEFQKEGAQTGYRDQFANAEARAEEIQSEFKQFQEGKPIKFGRAIFQWLSDYNETMENAVRLAAYKVAKEDGISTQQAASLAKTLTVNFNRKGSATTQIGALYAFFNASVQGTARIAETLFEKNNGDFKKIRLSKLGKKVVAGGILLGVMQALLLEAAGYDDDEPPEFVRERSLVFPIGNGKYLSLPMPLGFHAIPGLGRIATEFILGGGKDPAKRVTDMLGMFVEAFNPVGSSGISIQSLTPSVIDPLAALAENRDFTGREIYRENFNANDPSPGHARAKDVATPWARFISEGINWATGGTEFKPGAFSPSPDAIDYLVAQVFGGVGREANKVAQTVKAGATGDDLPLYKVPLVGRFVGDTEGLSGNSQKFYNAVREINLHEREVKGLREAGRNAEAHQYVAENPAYRLAKLANATETQVRKLRDQRRKASESGDSAKVREINDRISAILVRFNERAAPLLE